jgi:dipeptidyl aminopeptidase/acylaminoacyl peptidase
MNTRAFFITLGLLLAFDVCAETLPVNAWLTVSRSLDVPVFSDSTNLSSLLNADQLDFASLRPREGEFGPGTFDPHERWKAGSRAEWPQPAYGSRVRVGYAATYVTSSRNQEVKLRASSRSPFALYVDGKEVGRAVSKSDSGFRLDCPAAFEHGKSLLLVKAILFREESPAELQLDFELNPVQSGTLQVSTDANYTLARFEDLTLFDDVSSPAISRDGKYAAYIRSRYKSDHTRESWLEMIEIENHHVIYSTPPLKKLGNLHFLPSAENILVYTTAGDKGSTIWKMWVPQCVPQMVVREVEDFVKIAFGGGHTPRLYFTTDPESKESDKDYLLLDELEDRLSDWTRTRKLFAVPLEGGVISQVTSANDSFAMDEFAPSAESGRLLFTRRLPKLARPYFDTEFWLLDTDKGSVRLVTSLPIVFETRPLSFVWLPGAREIAFVAAAHFTDPADTVYPSYSQTALYVLDVERGTLRNLTGGSRFSIQEDENRGAVRYNASDGTLYFRAVLGGRVVLMKIATNDPQAEAQIVPTVQPVVSDFDLAQDGGCVFVASGPQSPSALYFRNEDRSTVLCDPDEPLTGKVEQAGLSPWNFVNSSGDTIEGWLYFPPNFAAASHQWPLVVYFYGGASPRDLRFTYTYHWWVANGYAVYVLNPRGCVGYGEAFAADLANDWGTRASQDIIEGTRKLLASVPNLDSSRVGAYGGSYGGFIAMDLAVKTDLFAALCSQSGISNISSYFGVGEWGFTYGDLALPGSYPWNRRDVFVDKSPVFHADQVRTPLLLMHGTADVNVPAGESDQMFVAMKLLGKNVAYVRFKGEDHSFSKFSNRVAEREILREWFDRYLRSDPSDWNARWKKE